MNQNSPTQRANTPADGLPGGTRSLPWLLAAQTQVVFNDNAAKLALIGLIQFPGIVTQDKQLMLISLIAALLVLPFVLLAPVAGWVADRFPKRSLLNVLLVAQIAAGGWIAASLLLQNLAAAVAGFALLALQSCFFSPAKQAILKELVGERRLGVAVGWMEMLGTAAILGGSLVGAWLFDRFTPAVAFDAWTAALLVAILLCAGAVVSLLLFQPVRPTLAQTREPFRPSLLWEHFRQIKHLWQNRGLRLAALGNAYVYALGGVLYLSLIQAGRELHGGATGSVSEAGFLFAALGAGVAAGSLFAAGACRRRIDLGLIPFGSLGLAASLLALASVDGGVTRLAALFAVGLTAGIFVVPVNAYLQAKARDAERGRVIASNNLLTNLAGIGAVALHYFIAQVVGLSAQQQFLFLAISALLAAIYILRLLPGGFVALAVTTVVRLFYRPRLIGTEKIPSEGGVLLVANHVTYLDAIFLHLVSPRPVRFVAFSGLRDVGWLKLAFRLFSVIPIDRTRARDGIRTAVQALKEGEVVCVFPEGALTRTGSIQAMRKGFTLIARQAGVPVVPVHLDGLWGSYFSFSGNRFFGRKGERRRHPVSLRVGEAMPAHDANEAAVQQALLDLGNRSFGERPQLKEHLGRQLVAALRRSPWKTALIDRYPERRVVSRGMLLGLSLLLARRWRSRISGPRVGIALPPGLGGALANIACIFAGKTPVNLNFTAGRAAIASALRQGAIDTVITADAVRARVKDFPWPADIRDLAAEISACGRPRLISSLAAAWLLPARLLCASLRLPRKGGREECALLFTSGSSGEPKGVVLTHRNLLGNILQMSETNFLQRNDRVVGCLPLFHSFGFTVTLWTPLLRGLPIITYPSPLDPRKIAEAVEAEKATILAGTATFLRPYLKKTEPSQLTTLRMVVAGAEKVPEDLSHAFQERFGLTILEGYGLTETTPCLSVNMPEPPNPKFKAADQLARRSGSVGRLLPGISARLVSPETGEAIPLTETGLLQVRGPNVFAGYLHQPALTAKVLRDGWFNTGDVVRFDEEGFVHIVGRLSRFSKIAGEMVPHGALEEKIVEALGLGEADRPPVVVTGLPDAEKGEALVLLTAVEIDSTDLRRALTEAGVPNLWIPRTIVRVEEIPVLASGKLDLKACREMAERSLLAATA